jgi:hypothetical protein
MLLALFVLLFSFCSASQLHHSPCPPNGSSAWRDGILVVQCHRTPPCVEETWLTIERCRTLRLDKDWPTFDPHIRRDNAWTSFRQLLHDHVRGKTLLIAGDSIARQVYLGLACEAAREQLTLGASTGPQWDAFKSARAAVDASLWINGPPEGVYVSETDSVLALKWSSLEPSDTELWLGLADVVVANWGLHYFKKTEYESLLEPQFALFERFNKQPGKMAVFRETSAQAFEGTGSYVKGAETETKRCAATTDNIAAHSAVAQLNAASLRLAAMRSIPVLPFHDLTLPRWNMRHEKLCQIERMRGREDASEACGANAECLQECPTDCTHLCSSPVLWAKVADNLARVLLESRGKQGAWETMMV